ncbi:MAG: hypothetical protein K6G88_10990 [Lachnospiraceae bacterium]|nr:hypothetical protein [Lachnospiraceae bacterium]
MGKTRETIEKYNLMEIDRKIAENKELMNKLFSLIAGKHINDTLAKCTDLNFIPIFEGITALNQAKENNRDNLRDYYDTVFEARKSVAEEISSRLIELKFAGKDFFTKIIPDFLEKYNGKDKNEMSELVSLVVENTATAGYVKKLEKIDNSMGVKLVSGTVVKRVLTDNTDIYEKNIAHTRNFDYGVLQIEESTQFMTLDWKDYSNYITADGIALYNAIIGKINLALNEYCQKNKEYSFNKLALLPLQKMLYGEKTSLFEKLEDFSSDDELINAYNSFIKTVNDCKIAENIKKTIPSYDEIMIKTNKINYYSNVITGQWSAVNRAMKDFLEDNGIKNADKYMEKGLTASEIEDALEHKNIKHTDFISNLITDLGHTYAEIKENKESLKKDDSLNSVIIKKELDKLLSVLQNLKVLDVDNEIFDTGFGIEVSKTIEVLGFGVPLYNKIRNYITRKPDPKKKFLTKFGSATIGTGLTTSVEGSKRATFIKDGDAVFLLLYNGYGCKANNISVSNLAAIINSELRDTNNGNSYQKMIYQTPGDIKKQIPRVFVYKSEDEELIKDFKAKLHKTDLSFLNERLIPYLKEAFANHETYKNYKFSYKNSYESYDEFCEHMSEQAYILEWQWIDKKLIDDLVEDGSLLMFRVWNRFMKKKDGKISKHAKIINELFSERNTSNAAIKLLSVFDIFYRDKQIDNPIVHKAGSTLYNKRSKDGEVISDYSSMVKNKEKRENVYTTTKKYDIIKDRRYTEEQFELHIHVQLGKEENKEILETSKLINEKKNTLVVTRSNEHLLYAVVFDENDNILLKKSLNTVKGMNFKSKLEAVEIQKKENMQSWKTVGSNHALMEGYLSFAIKEIADLIKEYDAILVLEQNSIGKNLLNERVYTRFKEMLLTNLSLDIDYVNNDFYSYTEVGQKVSSWRDSVTNGICIQVPSAYKYKDPTTTYSPVSMYAKTTAEKTKKLKQIKSFKYNREKGLFELVIAKGVGLENNIVCDSFGARSTIENDIAKEVNCTIKIEKYLIDAGIEYNDEGEILKELDTATKTDAVHKAISLLLKCFNDEAGGRYYISPCGEHFTLYDTPEVLSAINYYIRSQYIRRQIVEGVKKVDYKKIILLAG